jgi:phosphate/sulfate permease
MLWYRLMPDDSDSGGISVEFQNMTVEMQREFMSAYNERAGKKPFYWMLVFGGVFLIVGWWVFYEIGRVAGYGHDFPTWFLALGMSWWVIGPLFGGKLGVRLFHIVNRDKLIRAIQQDIANNEYLTEEQKEVLKNYAIYHIDTATIRFRDIAS